MSPFLSDLIIKSTVPLQRLQTPSKNTTGCFDKDSALSDLGGSFITNLIGDNGLGWAIYS